MAETDDIIVNQNLATLDGIIRTLGDCGISQKLTKIRADLVEGAKTHTAWVEYTAPMRADWAKVCELIEVDPRNRHEVFETLDNVRAIREAMRYLIRGS